MVRIIIYISTVLLFMGPSILYSMNFSVEGQENNHLYPSFYLLVCGICYIIVVRNIQLTKAPDKYIWLLLVFVVLFCLGFGVTRGIFYRPLLITSIALPALYGLFFVNIGSTEMHGVQWLVLFMFIINCTFAIGERLFLHNVFPMSAIFKYMTFAQTNPELFRSTALLGHPLNNALITAIIMGFITISALKDIYKVGLLLLGFFALICFNARGAILISGLFIAIFFIRQLFDRNKSQKSKIYSMAFLVACTVMFVFLLSNEFGGRFFEHTIKNDGSILLRLQAWHLIKKPPIESLLFGIDNVKDYTTNILGTFHIENWFVLSVLNIGIVPTMIFMIIYVPIFRFFLIPFTRFQTLFLLGIFIGIASTNNSLSSGTPAISVFFVCARTFSHEKSDRIYALVMKLKSIIR